MNYEMIDIDHSSKLVNNCILNQQQQPHESNLLNLKPGKN